MPHLMGLQVAEKLAEKGWLPDLIVSSDSTRTKQTLDTMAEAHPAFSQADTLFRGSLYTVAALDGQTRKHLQVSTLPDVRKAPCGGLGLRLGRWPRGGSMGEGILHRLASMLTFQLCKLPPLCMAQASLNIWRP